MPNLKTQSRLGLIRALLEPIQDILGDLLDRELTRKLSKAGRKALAEEADAALVRRFPLARIIPPATRRRIIAAQLAVVLDQIVFNEELPASNAGTGFEGIILRTISGGTAAPMQIAERAVLKVLGPGWTIVPLPLDDRSFHIQSDVLALSVPDAWEVTHELKRQPGIAHAEPDFILPLESNMPDEGPVLAARAFAVSSAAAAGANNPEWSINAIKVREAWALTPPPGGQQKGAGIIVGHPDTGYTRHPENWSDNSVKNKILHKFGFDLWRNDGDATDDLDSGFFCGIHAGFACLPGHGTGTSSVIFSDEGSPSGGAQFVTGVAPGVRLIPFRVAPTVVIWNQRRLADAIIRATDTGCHVISISLGGVPLDYLLAAVKCAVSKWRDRLLRRGQCFWRQQCAAGRGLAGGVRRSDRRCRQQCREQAMEGQLPWETGRYHCAR